MRNSLWGRLIFVTWCCVCGIGALLAIQCEWRKSQTITITEKDIHELKDENPEDREKIAEIKRMLSDTNGWLTAGDGAVKVYVSDTNATVRINGKKAKPVNELPGR